MRRARKEAQKEKMYFRKNNPRDAFIAFLIDKVIVPELESKKGEFQNV